MTAVGRDGHLHDLGVEQVLAGELGDEQPAIEAHLAACPACAARVAAARTDDALAPPIRRLPTPANRGRWGLAGLVAAAAAAAAIGLSSGDPDLTPKGAGLALEVFVDRGPTSPRLGWGDPVRPGDRIGFRVRSGVAAQLLVVGIDDTGAVYPCWPSDGIAAPVDASPTPQDLAAAIRLDPTPGAERIVAVACPDGFSIADLHDPLVERASSVGPSERSATIRAGCVQDELRLVKEVPR
ncbi:MAG: hypothetical protein ABMB14_19785 [Myxococcota bacterium]